MKKKGGRDGWVGGWKERIMMLDPGKERSIFKRGRAEEAKEISTQYLGGGTKIQQKKKYDIRLRRRGGHIKKVKRRRETEKGGGIILLRIRRGKIRGVECRKNPTSYIGEGKKGERKNKIRNLSERKKS